jgi:uncharacterized delta-60 repeat protein
MVGPPDQEKSMSRTLSGARFVAALAIAMLPVPAGAAPGDLDTAFGSGGIAVVSIGAFDDHGQAIAIQSDGRIVVAGYAFNGLDEDFALARFTASGALDPDFGIGGVASAPIGGSTDFAVSAVVQGAGAIVLAGSSFNGTDEDFALARFELDGQLDATFGTLGKVTTPIGSGYDTGRAAAIDSDGRILLAGYSFNGSDFDFALVRYDEDGLLDAAFGANGKVTTPVGPSHDFARSVAVQADGRIVLGGYLFNGVDEDFAVVRYNSDGTLDTSFGVGGVAITPVGPSSDVGLSVAVHEGGGIVLAGKSFNGTDDDFATVRYTGSGTLDSTFGLGGKAVTAIGASTDFGRSVLLQTNGKVVVAGYSWNGLDEDFALVRYDQDGMLDTSFGTGGKVVAPVGTGADFGIATALHYDGQILVAGSSANEGSLDFSLARFVGDPTCGDGELSAFEDCDDENTVDGDCCSSTCHYDPVDSPCPDDDLCNGDETCDGAGTCDPGIALDCGEDGNPCTEDACDPIDGCVTLPEPVDTPCPDGDVCNGDETCDGTGTCDPGMIFNCDDGDACTQSFCDPVDGCVHPAEPATRCLTAWAKGSLLVKENVAGREKFLARLLNGPALGQSDFGDPLLGAGTAYTICLYDDADGLAGQVEVDRAGQQCAGNDCWRPLGPLGYLYKDKDASANGMTSMKLFGGAAGKSRILLRAANNSLKGQTSLPTGIAAALAGSSSATVQIHGSDTPGCFSTTLSRVAKDTGSLFKAK